MLQFLAKSIVDLAVSIPQSILSVLRQGEFEILQYEVFTCRAVSSRVRHASLEVYERCTEPGNGQYSEVWSLPQSGRSAGLSLLAGSACAKLFSVSITGAEDRRYLHLSSFVFAMANGAAATLHRDPTVRRAVRTRDSDTTPTAGLRSDSPLKGSDRKSLEWKDFEAHLLA